MIFWQWLVFINVCKVICGELEEFDNVERKGMFGFIVGGVEAPIAMFPHVAFMSKDGRPHCGGSIISNRVILTAAHCTMGEIDRKTHPPKTIDVYLGSSKLMHGAKYQVCRVVAHENYRPIDYTFDIGLLLLRRKIFFGPVVQKVKIATNERWKNSKYTMVVAGFGVVSSEGGISKHLKMTHMRYVDARVCNVSQTEDGVMYVPNHMFCMIGVGWTSDCFGDSGSGILWKQTVIGVVSTGRASNCGSDVMPSMYTNAVKLKGWIDSNVKRLESSNTCKK